MRKLFSKSKGFIAGVMIGIVVTASVPVLADNVTAVVDKTIRIMIDSNMSDVPEQYEVLNYKGYTYLPFRYVAEQMGATVQWDEGQRIITIKSPEPKVIEKEVPVEVEKIVYVEKEVPASQQLPAQASKDNILLYVTRVGAYSSSMGYMPQTRVNCKVTNNISSDNIIVQYENAVLIAEGKEYKTSDLPATYWDSRLYGNDILPTKEAEGYLAFPEIPIDAKNFTVKLPVRNQAQGTNSTVEISFTATIQE